MSESAAERAPRAIVVGGGLAGLAAAVALVERGIHVDLFEARSRLGGRAASFRDPSTGELVDHCQHVSMGCCTNLSEFCRRTGLESLIRRDRVLHFFAPDGTRYDLAATRWLPAPLHLAPSLMRLGYLSLAERCSVARSLLRLVRRRDDSGAEEMTMGRWLAEQRQSPRAIERFWSVVLVSALGESLDRAGVSQARKVFLDGFFAAADAYEVLIPEVPLGELYGERLTDWLIRHGVGLHLGVAVRSVEVVDRVMPRVTLDDGLEREADCVIVAVPWRRVRDLFSSEALAALPELDGVDSIGAAPITGVHLWYDRPITPLPHAVIVGRLSQWLFNRGRTSRDRANMNDRASTNEEHYYQVVISASRDLSGRPRQAIVEEVHADLAAVWPAAREARLLRSRVVTEPSAVFSVAPGIEALRPSQQSSVPALAWAGDWTDTGWPATMEGAVRSGYLAAEAVLRPLHRADRVLVPDLPRGWLAQRLCR